MECNICKSNAHVKCGVCSNCICTGDSRIVVSCKTHLQKPKKLDVKIRPAERRDKKEIEAIENSTILEHDADIDEAEWEKKWGGIGLKQLVAECKGKVAGFVEYCKSASPYEEPILMVTDFAVLPEFQDAGVGSRLLSELKTIAKSSGLSKIYASTAINNIPVIMFHLKHGAEILGVESTEEFSERWGMKGSESIAFVHFI